MEKKTLRRRQKIKTINRTILMVSCVSLLGLATYFFILFNSSQTEESNAGLFENMMMGYSLEPGETIMEFNWEQPEIATSKTGPDAINITDGELYVLEGTNSTSINHGIGPAKSSKNFLIELPAIKELNLGGIDVSIDYSYSNKNVSFFSRGKHFDFGIENNKIYISYSLKNEDSEAEHTRETTSFTIPTDEKFRTYRFRCDPVDGHAEILVNNIAIWSHDHKARSALKWNENATMKIGKGIRYKGGPKAYLDNIIIKSTRQIPELPVTLLNFEAKAEEDYVMIQWYTLKEIDIDTFIVERSTDAINFIEVGKIKASGYSNTLLAYALVDSKPEVGLVYYRLIPSNKPVKSVTIPLIGYKYRGQGNDLKLEDIVNTIGQ